MLLSNKNNDCTINIAGLDCFCAVASDRSGQWEKQRQGAQIGERSERWWWRQETWRKKCKRKRCDWQMKRWKWAVWRWTSRDTSREALTNDTHRRSTASSAASSAPTSPTNPDTSPTSTSETWPYSSSSPTDWLTDHFSAHACLRLYS